MPCKGYSFFNQYLEDFKEQSYIKSWIQCSPLVSTLDNEQKKGTTFKNLSYLLYNIHTTYRGAHECVTFCNTI